MGISRTRMSEVKTDLCTLHERITELCRQEEDISKMSVGPGHFSAESELPRDAGVDDIVAAATEVEPTTGALLQDIGHSNLVLRRMWESLEESEAAHERKVAVSRSRAWAAFDGG